jgi:hypothetical protein
MTADTMTPADLTAARLALGLTPAQMGAVLECDAQTVRRMEGPAENVTARKPAARMVRLIRLYLAGARPSDWPAPAAQAAAATMAAAIAAGLVPPAAAAEAAEARGMLADLRAAAQACGADPAEAAALAQAVRDLSRDTRASAPRIAAAMRGAAAAGADPAATLAAGDRFARSITPADR